MYLSPSFELYPQLANGDVCVCVCVHGYTRATRYVCVYMNLCVWRACMGCMYGIYISVQGKIGFLRNNTGVGGG